jgi:hypothetical protein
MSQASADPLIVMLMTPWHENIRPVFRPAGGGQMRLLWAIVGMCAVSLGAAGQALADCHHAHKSYPEKSAYCQGGSVFVCGEFGAWRRTSASCDAKAASAPALPAASKDDAAKEKRPAGSTPRSG